MNNFVLLGLAVLLLIGITNALPQPEGAAVHLSGKLQQRRSINIGGPCDADFGSQLEAIVNEMEQNKEAPEELVNKLRTQFTEIMDKNSEKQLCVKDSWCDMGVCKVRSLKRVRRQGDVETSPATTKKDDNGGGGGGGSSTVPEGNSSDRGVSTTSFNIVGIVVFSICTAFASI